MVLPQAIARWYPIPSLVDHHDGPDHPSLVTHRRNTGRVAHEFIGEDASSLELDWNTPATR